MKTTGPFYLSVTDNPTSNVWYKKTPMGKNTINNIIKTMKENSPLNDMIPDKKLTNHSERKTVVKKLKSCGVPKKYYRSQVRAGSRRLRFGRRKGTASAFKYNRRYCQYVGNMSANITVRQQYSMPLSPRNVYNFQNCQVTFNTAGNNCTQASSALAQTKRPLKRCILYSDSDSD